MRKLKEWADKEKVTGKDERLDEASEKVEKNLKRKIRECVDKE